MGVSCEKGHGTAKENPPSCPLAFPSSTDEFHSLGRGAAHLKHLLDVAVPGFEQLPPRGEVAVGEDPSWPQQAEGVALPRELGNFGNLGQLLLLSPRPQLPLQPQLPPSCHLDEVELMRVPGVL